MDASEVTEVCRLCPTKVANQNLLSVFDERLSVKNNMKEVILVTTGIEILESDIISKKICQKCYKNTLDIFEIRQTALQQNQHLKEKCQEYLSDKGIRLPNTCITIKKDTRLPCQSEQQKINLNDEPSMSSESVETKRDQFQQQKDINVAPPVPTRSVRSIKGLHPSIIDVYRKYPQFKLPKKCLERHMAPTVALSMGEVETYFRQYKLDMSKYICKPSLNNIQNQSVNKVAKKKTSTPSKTVCPLKIRKSFQNQDSSDNNNYTCLSSTRRNVICSPESTSSVTEMNNESNVDKTRISKVNLIPMIRSHSRLKEKCNIISHQRIPSPKEKARGSSISLASKVSENNHCTSKENLMSNPASSSVSQCTNETNQPIGAIPDSVCSTSVEESAHRENTEINRLEIPILTNSIICSPLPEVTSSNKEMTPNLGVKKKIKRKMREPKDIFGSLKLRETPNNENVSTSNIFNKYAETNPTQSIETQPTVHNISSSASTLPNLSLDITKSTITSIESADKLTQKVVASEESPGLNTSKPEFIQSLGLTPAMGSNQSKNILICKICNSVHNNIAALKKHSSRHRVCPFCKVKFKSTEEKQSHIDNDCEVKNITESQGPFISLERIDYNSEIEKQYKDAFSSVGTFTKMDLTEPDDVIILSDDEEPQANSNELDVSVPTDISKSEDTKIESVSIVRPIVSIHKNTILNKIGNNLTEMQLIKELYRLVKEKHPITTEQAVETAPGNQDVIISKNDTCRLKNFKNNLLSHVVPVTLNNGNFNVSFTPNTNEVKKTTNLMDWSSVPLVEKRTPKTTQEIPLMNATYPLTFVTSQVQSSQLSLSSIQLMTATPTMSIFLPNTSTFIPSTGLSIQQGINSNVTQTQTINNTFFSPISNTSIQTTPLLQNYTLSMAPLPVMSEQVPIQSTSDKSVIPNNETPSENIPATSISNLVTSSSTVSSSSQASSSRKSFPAISNTRKVPISPRRSLSALTKSATKPKSQRKRKIIKVKIGNLASLSSSKSSKLRVKNLWELK